MDRFPLDSVAFEYANRYGERPGDHRGTDVFAPRGTVVQAVETGYVWRDDDTKGGQVVYLTCPKTGRQYYYAHLDSVEHRIPYVDPTKDPLLVPIEVVAGERLGTVGTTGNAKDTPPHLHFQMRVDVGMPGLPRGRIVNPYPYLRKVDPHLVSKPGPFETPTVGPGKTAPWGTSTKGKPWWDLSWMQAAGSGEMLVLGGLVLWFLSSTKERR